MDRRRFLGTAGGVVAAAATAGCLGIFGGNTPPPRRSKVFEEVTTRSRKLVVRLESTPKVESRAEVNAGLAAPATLAGLLGAASPVGVARAGGRGGRGGRGATGRGRRSGGAVPTGSNGHKKYHGGDYDDWREEHSGEVQFYRAKVGTVGVARIGDPLDTGEDLPGPGPVAWDETYDASAGEKVSYDLQRPGWYRVGCKLRADGASHDFGWEAVDVRIVRGADSYDIRSRWKMSPRL